MAKEFVFKLDKLLKIIELKEQILMSELGTINRNIEKCNQEITILHKQISDLYAHQESASMANTTAMSLQMFPEDIQVKRQFIEEKKLDLRDLYRKYEEKSIEIHRIKEKSKTLNEYRDKKFMLYKKDIEKIEQDSIAELNSMYIHYLKRGRK